MKKIFVKERNLNYKAIFEFLPGSEVIIFKRLYFIFFQKREKFKLYSEGEGLIFYINFEENVLICLAEGKANIFMLSALQYNHFVDTGELNYTLIFDNLLR